MKLMEDKTFVSFSLAGGTALALQVGHRISIDLDFFTTEVFDEDSLKNHLISKYRMQLTSINDNSLSGSIGGIKIDFLAHQYSKLEGDQTLEGVRLWSLKDIAAMKLNAICNRSCKKDFCDLFILLKKFSLHEMLGFYGSKYAQKDMMMAVKSLVYFEDANSEPEPIWINNRVTWEEMQSSIMVETKKYIS